MKLKAYILNTTAIKAGSNESGKVEKDVDVTQLTETERKTLADAIEWQSDNMIGYDQGVIDLEHVRAYLAARLAAQAADDEKEKKKSADQLKNSERIIRERITTDRLENISFDDGKWTEYRKLKPDSDCETPAEIFERPDVVAWQAELDKLNEAAKLAAIAAKREELAKKKAAEAKADAEKAQWIAAHGSRRLKAALKEGIEHEAVYRDERLAVERPGWSRKEDYAGDDYDPRNPSEEAFDLLDQARQTEPNATLRYWKQDADRDEAGDEIEAWRGYCAIAQYMGSSIVFGLPDELRSR